jgi:ribosome-associated heat shock protein Hsp15
VEQVRVDKWLWAARFFKTRSLATDSVAAGHVQLNGARVKPAKEVHVGVVLAIRIGTESWTVAVRGLSDKRGPASVAATLYVETAESSRAREEQRIERRLTRPVGTDLGMRPTKQDRRRLDALRRAQRRGG